MEIASYEDIVNTVADILMKDWQLKNMEPFYNCGDFPKQMAELLAKRLIFLASQDDGMDDAIIGRLA